MAKRTIRQRIALDGGAEIKKELQEFGAVGEKAFKDLQAAIDRVDMKGLTGALQQAQKAFVETGKSFQKFGRDMQGVGRNFSTFISLPIIAGFTASAKAAIDFESAMADVRKVVEFPTPEAFAQMSKDISDMSLRLPVAAEGLAAIASAAGQAGIGADELTNFTELVAKASVAFELTADEAGSALAKIKTALGLTVPEVEQLTDAFNQLANNAATSEAEVLDVVLRVAPLGEMAGIAAKEIAAIGSAMVSMGVDSERAATGLRNILLRMQAGTQATKEQQEAWKQLGLDAVKVQRDIQKRGVGAILDVFERINRQAPEVRASIVNALFGERVVDAAGPLIGNLQELRRQLGLVANDADFAGSTAREFGVRSETTANQMQLFVNSVSELRRSFGDEMLPVLNDFIAGARDLLAAFSDLEPATKRLILSIGLIAAAVGPALIGLGLMISSLGTIVGAIGRVVGGIGLLIARFGLLRAAMLSIPGLAVFTAIGGAIALWASSTNEATAALERNEGVVNDLAAAYEKAGREVANMAKEVKDNLFVQTTAAMKETEAALASALGQLKSELQIVSKQEGVGPIVQSFIDGASSVEEMTKALAAFGAENPDLAPDIAQLLEWSKAAKDLAAGQQANTDWIDLLTGKISNAEFLARKTGEAFREIAPEGIDKVGAAIDETKTKVEALNGAITVTRHGAAEPVKEAFTVVDGIAQAVQKSTEEIGKLDESAKAAGEGIKAVAGDVQLVVRSAPAALDQEGVKATADAVVADLQRIGPAAAEAATAANAALAGIGIGAAQAATEDGAQAQTGGAAAGIIAEIDRIGPAAAAVAAEANAALGTIGAVDATAAAAAADAIIAPFRTIAGQIAQIFSEIRALVQSGFQGIASTVNQIAQQIQATINRILAALRAAAAAAARLRAQAASGAGGGGGGAPRVPGAPQFASGGGPLRGPGTTTSDSIPILASLGEFITRAKAVSYYGPELFHALNQMRLPKDFWKGLRGFSMGGLMDGFERSLAVPRMAMGGLVPAAAAPVAGRTAVFNLPGGESFSFIDPDDVAEKFARAVTARSVRSAGRKPGWSR